MPTQIPAQGIAAGAITADKIAAGAVTAEKIAAGVSLGSPTPTIATVAITNNAYTVLDDTAVDVAGGYIRITGTNFQSGCQVMVGLLSATSVTFTSATELRVQVPAQAAGTYPIYVINPDGVTAAKLVGLTYSGIPTWTTNSTLPEGTNNTAYSQVLAANGATSFSVAAGSSLPPGMTLNSTSGLLSGTVVLNTATTYTFTLLATDAELQDAPRTFSLYVSTVPPFAGLTAYGTTSGATTGTFMPTQSTITVYGCGGGGSGGRSNGTWNGGFAFGGGGGAAAQLNGYSLATTPYETLSYSVGGPGQATTISRGGTVIFELNPGGSAGAEQQGGASGGAANSYASHAGGGGGSGGSRDGAGTGGAGGTGCGGGGGGGGHGDNSPLRAGQPGGSGGSSSIANGIFVGGAGGAAGGAAQVGSNKPLAVGGQRAGTDIWIGGGGGAGAGIRLASSGSNDLYGGGGGGNGAAATSSANLGGPGLLHITV